MLAKIKASFLMVKFSSVPILTLVLSPFLERILEGDSDVGDIVMLVNLWWWLISDVGVRILMLTTFVVMLVIFSMY